MAENKIELSSEKFDAFEKELDASSLSENETLTELLKRPKRWAGNVPVAENTDDSSKSSN